MKNDDDTTPIKSHPVQHQTPPHGTDCPNERRFRILERKVEGHDVRLGEGTRTMDRLTMSVDALTKSVDVLNVKMAESLKPNPWLQKCMDAAINALVPAAILAFLAMLLWVAVSSGVLAIKGVEVTPTKKETL